MKIKLLKNKKIILLISGLGILTTSIVTPILVINNKNNKQEKENSEDLNKINEIIAKIKDKDILIPANVSTQNQSEIQNAIKVQLKKENQTLSEDDLSKITINNIGTLRLGSQIEVTLIIKINSIIEKLTINVEKINLLKNSNIDNGFRGTIFHDKFKNLWAIGDSKKLQVLKANSEGNGYVNEGWTSDYSKELLKGSNIANGRFGKIFQDSFKNLWILSDIRPLQVLKVNNSKDGYVKSWTNDISQGLTKNSNIYYGLGGTIFQDKFKNLWAMGKGRKLQVLKANSEGNGYVTTGWTDNTTQGLLKGSNIVDGNSGTIFQDSFGNLWAMSLIKKLQVLKANNSKDGYVIQGWTDVNNTQGLLNGSNITSGENGKIFQDSFKNLWAMANGTKLQVLKANLGGKGYENAWVNNNDKNTRNELLKNSNIDNGFYGQIFQDSFRNLWAMGKGRKLQVLKANNSKDGYVIQGWTDVNNTQGLLNGSNIVDGNSGTIFQDSFGNLWAMTNRRKLQVLKAKSDGSGYVESWTDNNIKGLLNGSNITNGNGGMIFQDSFKNLWAMGNGTPLQVLKVNSNNTGYINSWL